MFDSPNLDCLSVDAEDYREASEVLRNLSAYAELKGEAIEQRMSGNIDGALRLEETCEAIYARLPQWAKW